MVYLTLQQNYGERCHSYSRTVAIQKCGNPPYEIALRFANCILKCGACFAASYSWTDRFENNRRVIRAVSIEKLIDDFEKIPAATGPYNWLRILGGEPLLNDEYIDYVFDFIIEASKVNSNKFRNGVIIQTNGIHIGKGNIDVLNKKIKKLYKINPNVLVIIEISIKGTNPFEFELLTQSSKDLYYYNIQSFYNLKNLTLPNLRPVIIAGFGINESYLLTEGKTQHRITVLYDENTPVYHPDNWDEQFARLYRDFTTEYSIIDRFFTRMPMYGIKDQFQYGWVRLAIDTGKAIFGDRWYDAKYVEKRNEIVESKFKDILDKFCLKSNQEYYSKLIQLR